VTYLSAPGTVEEFAHPIPGGDVCTVIGFQPGVIAALSGGDSGLCEPTLPMDAASELALRHVIGLARLGDPEAAWPSRSFGSPPPYSPAGSPTGSAAAARPPLRHAGGWSTRPRPRWPPTRAWGWSA
jgi:hypothetical protein